MITVSVQPSIIGAIFSFDGGTSWTDSGFVQVNDDCRFPVNVNGCSLEGSAAVTWCDQPEDLEVNNWEVYYATSNNVLNDDWTVYKQLSSDSAYSIQPTIDSNADSSVYVAWAERDGDIFNIFFRKSTKCGSVWNNPAIPGPPVTGSGGAWQPDLAFDRTTSAQADLVWVKSTGGDGMLYYSHYSGTSWVNTGAAEIPAPDGSVNEPDFAIDDDGNTFVVYTDVTESSSIVEWDQDPSE
jgi:hypothetical protein